VRAVLPAQRRQTPLHLIGGGCLAIAGLTLFLPSTPTYDPWAWMVWGRELAGLELDTSAGPAFKPLPVAVGALLSPLGEAAPWAWLTIARAGALLSIAMSWRLARRLTGGSAPAAALAAASVALVGGWVWNGALGNAEGLMLALSLLAFERRLDGHARQALGLGLGAALVRTEAVPFLLVYCAWLWRRDAPLRPLLVAAVATLPVLWLGPDLLGSGDALRSSARARVPGSGAPALAERPSLESLGRAASLAPTIVWAGGLLGLLGVRRRELPRLALLPAAAGVTWIGTVALMSELGYSGEERYAMPGVALVAITAGAGAGWALRGRRALIAAALVLAAVGESAPGLADDARSLRHEAALYGSLDDAVAAAGGRAAVLSCSPVHTASYSRPAMAWRLRVPISALSTDAARTGIAFRARPYRGAARGPLLEPASGFRRAASSGPWEVVTRC
jgi:hypothetical protein